MKINLQKKISILIIGLVVLLGTANLFAVYTNSVKQSKHEGEIYYQNFQKSINADRKALEVALTNILNREDFQTAFVEQDREKLLEITQGLFEELKTKFNITHFYFHNKDGINFLRVHKPGQNGDEIKRYTFQDAVKQNKMVGGLETGATAFAYRVVSPVYVDGELIGYEEVGQEIDKILEEFKETTGGNISFIVREDFVDKGKFSEELVYNNSIIYSSTDAKEAKDVLLKIDYKNDREREEIFKPLVFSNDKTLFVLVKKLIDASGKPVGDIVITGNAEHMLNSLLTNVAVMVILLILLAGIVYIVARKPLSSIVNISKSMQDASQGNLAVEEVAITDNDEIGELGNSFNIMTKNLRKLIASISNSAASVADYSTELSSTSESLNVALEGISQTTLELSAVAQQGAENAHKAAEVSESVSEIAQNGMDSVNLTLKTINQIKTSTAETAQIIDKLDTSSQQIGDIVDAITEIADQTNLLSLNAAIEAARAGESGKGFAVVADEVRKLAGQAANAAKEIRFLVEKIQQETARAVQAVRKTDEDVQEGVKISEETGAAFERIAQDITNLVQTIKEMAEASGHTNAGAENVAASIEQSTAAMQQLSASATSMSEMSKELKQLISKFKL